MGWSSEETFVAPAHFLHHRKFRDEPSSFAEVFAVAGHLILPVARGADWPLRAHVSLMGAGIQPLSAPRDRLRF